MSDHIVLEVKKKKHFIFVVHLVSFSGVYKSVMCILSPPKKLES